MRQIRNKKKRGFETRGQNVTDVAKKWVGLQDTKLLLAQ
jgi:hypothetical protein